MSRGNKASGAKAAVLQVLADRKRRSYQTIAFELAEHFTANAIAVALTVLARSGKVSREKVDGKFEYSAASTGEVAS